MVFSSLIFILFFLPISIVLYYAVEDIKYKDIILIISSLIFYAWGEPVWIVLLLLSTLVDYHCSNRIAQTDNKKLKTMYLVFSVIFNLSMLIIFKYSGFIIDNFSFLIGRKISCVSFSLPIGISFYTFQTMSYTIDVYKGEVPAQKSFTKLLLFVSLFHQLVAGPIVRYADVNEQIEHRQLSVARFSKGLNRFILGLGKKVIIANTAGSIASPILEANLSNLTIFSAWMGIFMFALQIYFDFSGYSDMAIGLGDIFGFTYRENFNYPYIARSATDFWRRWHISLGSFFRDYVYIPLGGKYSHRVRNLFIVWFLTGLWHGASWNFVLWGLYYGILIALEKIISDRVKVKIPVIFSHIYLIIVVLIGWSIFYFENTNEMFMFFSKLSPFNINGWMSPYDGVNLFSNVFFIAIAVLTSTPLLRLIYQKIKDYNMNIGQVLRLGFNVIVIIVSLALLIGDTYNPFLYFRF